MNATRRHRASSSKSLMRPSQIVRRRSSRLRHPCTSANHFLFLPHPITVAVPCSHRVHKEWSPSSLGCLECHNYCVRTVSRNSWDLRSLAYLTCGRFRVHNSTRNVDVVARFEREQTPEGDFHEPVSPGAEDAAAVNHTALDGDNAGTGLHSESDSRPTGKYPRTCLPPQTSPKHSHNHRRRW